MTTASARRPSPLQRKILILLAGLAQHGTVRARTRDLEQLLERGGDRPVYGNNLRDSCRRMEKAGWLRTLRAANLQLAVELTDIGRQLAAPLLASEQDRARTEQRATDVVVLPLIPVSPADGASAADRPVRLENIWYLVCRGDYVVRLGGGTCLQLWRAGGQLTRLAGDPLQVAQWLQACHDAGIEIRLQINESHTPEQGAVRESVPVDQTDTWYRQLEAALQGLGITGLTEAIRQAMVLPGESHLPPPARLLHILRKCPESFSLTAATCEEDTGSALDTLLVRAGFTPGEAFTLRTLRVQWPLMSDEGSD
jgi:hypothetical protein